MSTPPVFLAFLSPIVRDSPDLKRIRQIMSKLSNFREKRTKEGQWCPIADKKNYPRGMEEWINKNGKLVCSLCGTSIERGMPFKGQKLTFYRGWYVKDEMHDIRNGYDQCRCKSDYSYASDMRKQYLAEARERYEADSWKRRVMTILFVALAIGVFLFFDFS